MSTWCAKCGTLIVSVHDCVRWQVFCHEHESARTVYATSPREAAERWAREEDGRGDYDIVRGNQDVVHVSDDRHENSEVRIFEVRGESEPIYIATEIDANGRAV